MHFTLPTFVNKYGGPVGCYPFIETRM